MESGREGGIGCKAQRGVRIAEAAKRRWAAKRKKNNDHKEHERERERESRGDKAAGEGGEGKRVS